MICQNCGVENKDGSVYCKNCGTSLNTSSYEKSKSSGSKVIILIAVIILAGGLCGAAMFFIPKVLDNNDSNRNSKVVQVETSSSQSMEFETSTEEETTLATTTSRESTTYSYSTSKESTSRETTRSINSGSSYNETTSRQTAAPTTEEEIYTEEETQDPLIGDQAALSVAEKAIKAVIESYTPDFAKTVPKCYLDLYGTDMLGKYVDARLQTLEENLTSYYGDGDVSYEIMQIDSLTIEEMQEREVNYIEDGMDIKITDGRRLQVKTYKEDEQSDSQITVIEIDGSWYFDLLNSN